MELSTLLDVLIQNGGLGIFAAYLIYEASRQRTQITSLTTVISGQSKDFGTELEKVRTDNRKNEEMLRERYDAVISDFQKKELTDRTEIMRQVEILSTKVEGLDTAIDGLTVSIGTIQKEVSEMRFRELARHKQ